MSWFQNVARSAEFVAKNLENVAHEAAKHVNAENIARGSEALRRNFDNAAQELGKHITAENIARGAEELRKNFDNAAQELGKHVNAENIARGGEALRRNFDNTAQEIGKHVTAENIARGAEALRKNFDNTAQELGKHVNAENIGRGVQELRKNWDNVAREVGKTAENARPHIEKATSTAKDLVDEASKHVTHEKIAVGGNALWNNFRNVVSQASQTVSEASRTHPAASIVAKSGVTAALTPTVVVAPLMAVAGSLGFTSGGVVAGSGAAAIQSAIGSVASPSLFATVQSAAAGGYGLGMITGAIQLSGVAMVAAAAGMIAWQHRYKIGGLFQGKKHKCPKKDE